MKKIMFALTCMFGGVVVLSAQDTTSYQYRTEPQTQYPGQSMTQQQDRERISATELPEEVKRQLEGQEFRGWLISGAFRYTGDPSAISSDTTSMGLPQEGINARSGEDQEYYVIELKNGAETQTIWFDQNGQEVQGMEDQSGMGAPYSPADGQGQPYQQNDPMNAPGMDQPEPTLPNDYQSPDRQQDPGQNNPGQSSDYNQENPYQPGQPQQPDQGSYQRDDAGQNDPTLESGTPERPGQSDQTGTDRGTP